MTAFEFEMWRENFTEEDGTVIPNVLFVRCSSGDVAYHMPVFDEEDIEDAKAILFIKVSKDLGLPA